MKLNTSALIYRDGAAQFQVGPKKIRFFSTCDALVIFYGIREKRIYLTAYHLRGHTQHGRHSAVSRQYLGVFLTGQRQLRIQTQNDLHSIIVPHQDHIYRHVPFGNHPGGGEGDGGVVGGGHGVRLVSLFHTTEGTRKSLNGVTNARNTAAYAGKGE